MFRPPQSHATNSPSLFSASPITRPPLLPPPLCPMLTLPDPEHVSVKCCFHDPEVKKKHVFSSSSMRLQRMFSKPKHLARFKSDDDDAVGNSRAPPMGEMRRFASGREAFANFDWKAQIAPEEIEQRGCFSDVEEVEDEVIIPFSAPILGGAPRVPNAQPRKEINLWKRRTMAPPRPLQLKA